MNKPIFIMISGIPASGKSTYAKQLESEGYIVHSSDSIRKELYGSEEIQGNPHEVFKVLHERVKQSLAEGKDVVYDATNLQSNRRRGFLQELRKYNCYKKCVFMAVPFEECIERNRKRERKVPEHKMKEMYLSYSPVGYHEGWDEILYIPHLGKEYIIPYISLLITKASMFNQNNPHHSLTLWEHLKKTKMPFMSNDSDLLIYLAAVFHDIGKMFTETKDEQGISHYYNHENVSSYIAGVIFSELIDDAITLKHVLYIQNLIYLHMRPFDWIYSNKAYNKAVSIYGQKLIDDVMRLHDADIKA